MYWSESCLKTDIFGPGSIRVNNYITPRRKTGGEGLSDVLRTVVNMYNVESIMKGGRVGGGGGNGVKNLSKKLYVIVEQPLRVVRPKYHIYCIPN